jgi:hypothetical protein
MGSIGAIGGLGDLALTVPVGEEAAGRKSDGDRFARSNFDCVVMSVASSSVSRRKQLLKVRDSLKCDVGSQPPKNCTSVNRAEYEITNGGLLTYPTR